MDQLRLDAVAAIRTLTLNLTRLSRVGVGASSRRGDLLRLARLVADSSGEQTTQLVNAAFGMHGSNHFGGPSSDADDPVSNVTSWWDAPLAVVPISLRERGDTAIRGNASPIADRTVAERDLRRRRDQELTAARRVDTELLAHGQLDGSHLSMAGLSRFEQLVGRALAQMPTEGRRVELVDGTLVCVLERTGQQSTTVSSPEGTLSLLNLSVRVRPAPVATR
jgi:uncharacterized protein (TIGR02677 family)